MKKIAIACLMTIGLLGTMPLNSCSSFFKTSETLQISEITHQVLEDGSIVIVIRYTDENVTPLTFTIPAGISGKDGVSIKNVTAEVQADNSTVLTITYSDESLQPTQITIPSGQSGKGISDVVIGKDDSGNTTIKFTYTDGTESAVMTITNGTNGTDGVGISDISYEVSEDGTYTVVTFTLSDETTKTVTLNNGKNGKEISSIYWDQSNSDEDNYTIVVTYTDDTSDNFTLARPRSTVWFYGTGSPASNSSTLSTSREGDYFFDTQSGNVYVKQGSSWIAVFKFSGTGVNISYDVTFYANGGTFYNGGTALSLASWVVKTSGNYIPLSNFPTISRSGYMFKGWYTSVDETNVNSGQLTDLTFINQDISVYARWTSN